MSIQRSGFVTVPSGGLLIAATGPVRVGLDSMGEMVNVEIALATAQAVASMKVVNGLE